MISASPCDLAALPNGEARCILDTRCVLGEGPRWHGGEARLYWVDIERRELWRWHPESGTSQFRRFDAPVACFAFRAGGGLLLGMQAGCATIDGWDAPVQPFGPQPLDGRADHRMNDGRTDPAGRFWVGSVDSGKQAHDATLYRLGADGALAEIAGGMLTCNGAAFSADGRQFRHTDTPSHALRAYDCDPASGTLSNERLFHQFVPGTGRPDGGSFDAEGCYWSALFDGGRVVRLGPDGQLLQTVALPVSRPTMIALSGADGRTAFVTSARTGLTDAQLAEQPLAGGLFAFRVDVPGVAESSFAG
jgi:sugar lactone lactonase YvrE